jgi:hypothetical protein
MSGMRRQWRGYLRVPLSLRNLNATGVGPLRDGCPVLGRRTTAHEVHDWLLWHPTELGSQRGRRLHQARQRERTATCCDGLDDGRCASESE